MARRHPKGSGSGWGDDDDDDDRSYHSVTPKGLRPMTTPPPAQYLQGGGGLGGGGHHYGSYHGSHAGHEAEEGGYQSPALSPHASPSKKHKDPKTTKTATQIVRGKVSKNKIRFMEDGFDLDLTYVKPRIIAMGFPSYGAESYYRNQIDEVERFFAERHTGRFFVYNLCSERTYDTPSRFDEQHTHIPFDDHNPPVPITLVREFCTHAMQFLDLHPEHVVAIHCKAGKGRTGVMIACLLLAQSCDHNGIPTIAALDALKEFGNGRTKDGKGVTIPSQIRYVHYWEDLLRHYGGEFPRDRRAVRLETLKICSSVKEKGINDLYFTVTLGFADGVRKELYDSRRDFTAKYSYRENGFFFDIAGVVARQVVLKGDVLFKVKKRNIISGDDNLFHFWLNVDLEARKYDADFFKVRLSKPEIDKAVKDKTHEVYKRGLAIELVLRTRPNGSDHGTLSPRSSPGSSPCSPTRALKQQPSVYTSHSTGALGPTPAAAPPPSFAGHLLFTRLGLNLPRDTAFPLDGVTMIVKIPGNDARQTPSAVPNEADTCVYVMWSDLPWAPLPVNTRDTAKIIVEIYASDNRLAGFKSLSLGELLPPQGVWEGGAARTNEVLWRDGLSVEGDLEAYRALLFVEGCFEVVERGQGRSSVGGGGPLPTAAADPTPDTSWGSVNLPHAHTPALADTLHHRHPTVAQSAASEVLSQLLLRSVNHLGAWGPAAVVVVLAATVAVTESRLATLSSFSSFKREKSQQSHRRNAISAAAPRACSPSLFVSVLDEHIPRVASVSVGASTTGTPNSSPRNAGLLSESEHSVPSVPPSPPASAAAPPPAVLGEAVLARHAAAHALAATFSVAHSMERWLLVDTCVVRYEEKQRIDLAMLDGLPTARGDRAIRVVDALELRSRNRSERDAWLAVMLGAAAGVPVAAQLQRAQAVRLLVVEEAHGRGGIAAAALAASAHTMAAHLAQLSQIAQHEAAQLARQLVRCRDVSRRLEEENKGLSQTNDQLTSRVQADDNDVLQLRTDASSPLDGMADGRGAPSAWDIDSAAGGFAERPDGPGTHAPTPVPTTNAACQTDVEASDATGDGSGRRASHAGQESATARTPGPAATDAAATLSPSTTAWGDQRAQHLGQLVVAACPMRCRDQQTRAERALGARVTRMAVNACVALHSHARRRLGMRYYARWQQWRLLQHRCSPKPHVLRHHPQYLSPPPQAAAVRAPPPPPSVGARASPREASPSPLPAAATVTTAPPDPALCHCPPDVRPAQGARSPRGRTPRRCPKCWKTPAPGVLGGGAAAGVYRGATTATEL